MAMDSIPVRFPEIYQGLCRMRKACSEYHRRP